MASIPVSVEQNLQGPGEGDGKSAPIRLILADTQAIFRAGLRKMFALEDDIRVVGQAETYPQTLSAIKKFTADILIFEAFCRIPSAGTGGFVAGGQMLFEFVAAFAECRNRSDWNRSRPAKSCWKSSCVHMGSAKTGWRATSM